MKKYGFIFMMLTLITLCMGDEDTKLWKHPEPMTYESLRAWHKEGGLKDRCPTERYLALKEDGRQEVFLGIEAYSRGMTYTDLFCLY